MGLNFTDYLREAYRTLKLDGQLYVIEATPRFNNLEQFKTGLHALGFDMVASENKDKLTHIRAVKSDRVLHHDLSLSFEVMRVIPLLPLHFESKI